MMTRRGFLKGLAALPIVGALVPQSLVGDVIAPEVFNLVTMPIAEHAAMHDACLTFGDWFAADLSKRWGEKINEMLLHGDGDVIDNNNHGHNRAQICAGEFDA